MTPRLEPSVSEEFLRSRRRPDGESFSQNPLKREVNRVHFGPRRNISCMLKMGFESKCNQKYDGHSNANQTKVFKAGDERPSRFLSSCSTCALSSVVDFFFFN